MFKTLGNLFTANWFITTFSTLIYNVHTNYSLYQFLEKQSDDNDDLVRYDKWFKKMRTIPTRFGPNHQQVIAIYHSKFISRLLHFLNASLSQTYRQIVYTSTHR